MNLEVVQNWLRGILKLTNVGFYPLSDAVSAVAHSPLYLLVLMIALDLITPLKVKKLSSRLIGVSAAILVSLAYIPWYMLVWFIIANGLALERDYSFESAALVCALAWFIFLLLVLVGKRIKTFTSHEESDEESEKSNASLCIKDMPKDPLERLMLLIEKFAALPIEVDGEAQETALLRDFEYLHIQSSQALEYAYETSLSQVNLPPHAAMMQALAQLGEVQITALESTSEKLDIATVKTLIQEDEATLQTAQLAVQAFNQAANEQNSQQDMSFDQALAQVAEDYGIERVSADQPNFHGYKLVESDASDTEIDAWYQQGTTRTRLNRQYVHGVAGSGLSTSSFGADKIQSGQLGEHILQNLVQQQHLPVISFWSLYGLGAQLQKVDADIDCVLLAQTAEGERLAWFVDAKRYAGGSDTAYVSCGDNQLVRLSVKQHALIAKINGTPLLNTSLNMLVQRKRWHKLLEKKNIRTRFRICMMPNTHGTPQVSNARWAQTASEDGIKAVSVPELFEEITSYNLVYPANIDQDAVQLFKHYVKSVN